MTELRGSRFTGILPEHLRNRETEALAYAVGRQVDKLLALAEGVPFYACLASAPETVLDHLAVELRTPAYQEAFPLEVKRTLIRDSLLAYAKMGTPSAINRTIQAIFGYSYVEEWFEYDGEPHHFRVVTTCQELAVKGTADLLRALETVKRLSSWMDDITLQISGDPFRSGGQRDFLLRRFLMLSMRFSHLRGSVVRWDGSVDYDGEILFDQVPMGIRLPAMRFCIRLRELRSRSIRWDGSVLHDGTIDFGQQIGSGGSPSFGVRLRAPHALAASVPELRMGGGIAHPSSARVSRSVFAAPCARHEGHIGGAVTMDNWRGMDGGLSFDGTYNFDAYLKKEEL